MIIDLQADSSIFFLFNEVSVILLFLGHPCISSEPEYREKLEKAGLTHESQTQLVRLK